MGKITVETCEIEGLKVITPQVFGDVRGYFVETYNYNDFKEAGIDQIFVQDNQSASVKNVLRGLHFQINHPQDKLVRVINGEVFDVAVDLRPTLPPLENGMEWFCLPRTRSSSLFPKTLPTVFWYCRTMRSLHTNARISIIPATREESGMTIRISAWNGP